MQKKLIALAIAGLSGAAFAQSNVTIYGAMDFTYDNVSATSATAATGAGNINNRGRTTMNSSFFGLKGAEDLGGGLKAVWQIESGVNENAGATNTMAASTNGLANRDTYVGIAGGFGTLVAGTLTGPARWIGAQMDVNSGATGIGANTALIGKLGGGAGAGYFDNRFSNAIAYISPKMGGFTGVLAYVPNENRSAVTAAGTEASNTNGWTLKALYEQGPITAVYGWTKLKDSGVTGFGPITTGVLGVGTAATVSNVAGVPTAVAAAGGAVVSDATSNRIGLKYNFGQGTVGFMWDQTKATLTAATNTVGAGTAKQSVWYIPVTFNMGSGKIIAQYGSAGKLENSYALAADDYKAKHIEIGYEHSLSKRTIAKVVYSAITNNKAATYDFLYGVSAPNTTAPGAGVAAGADPKGLSVGIRHSF